MQRFAPIISIVIFVGAVAGIVLPAFFPEWYMRYFMIALSSFFLVSSGYTFIIMTLFVKTPLTVVKTVIRIELSADFKVAHFNRTQIIRANRPDVSAYYTSARPSSKLGKITNLETTVYSPGAADLYNELELFGDEQKGYEII